MNTSKIESSVLLLTIGTGNQNNIEDSLYTPLQKSIDDGNWTQIILLPSQSTLQQAKEVKRRNNHLLIEPKIIPIPNDGDENDADATFTHFDQVLRKIIESDGIPSESITLDFTRGTKAMSAALVLAGVAWNIPILRYIEGERGDGGRVIAGTEKIKSVNPEVATARQQIIMIERLMRRGDFEAVSKLSIKNSSRKESLPESMLTQSKAYIYVAKIYAAWDRFDYKSALELMTNNEELISSAGEFSPTQEMKEWMGHLAEIPSREIDSDQYEERMAEYTGYLVCDLLANAERRFRDGHFEDAGTRWYRVLELIGQYRLFDHGYDSGRLPENDDKVKEFNNYLLKKKSKPLDSRNGFMTSSKFQTFRFLKKTFKDPMSTLLLSEANKDYVRARNHGLLAHGFKSLSSGLNQDDATEIIKSLNGILKRDKNISDQWILVARSLDFSQSRV
ncbi:MAG: TIGR02710 family CRISPR-associated CARF protein [Bacteroidetes bacterium]|nr:TIGR02710 family CRISPR-associated CARF protein [Bacteroidota bacterium]